MIQVSTLLLHFAIFWYTLYLAYEDFEDFNENVVAQALLEQMKFGNEKRFGRD